MKETIEINGQKFTVAELNAIIELAKNGKHMDKVYAYHNTTEEQFNAKHSNSSAFIKYIDREALIVSFYNKGEEVNFDNPEQEKWYPYFHMNSKNFRFGVSFYRCEASSAPASLCFLREADMKDAVEKFLPEYKDSRLSFNK